MLKMKLYRKAADEMQTLVQTQQGLEMQMRYGSGVDVQMMNLLSNSLFGKIFAFDQWRNFLGCFSSPIQVLKYKIECKN